MSDPRIEPLPEAGDDGSPATARAALPGDRTIFTLSGRLSGGQTGKAVLLAALLVGGGAFLWATWEREPPPPPRGEEPARQVVPFEPGAVLARAGRPTLADPGPNPPSLTGDDASAGSEMVPDLEGSAGSSAATAPQRAAAADGAPAKTPLLVYSRRSQPGASNTRDAMRVQPLAIGPTELSGLGQDSKISTLQAGRLPNRNYLILAGATLPCVLRTALDSTTPGQVACVIPKDIYSDNGAVVLLEKGARVLGEYQSASLKQGQKRIFVLWTRAVTPAGVSIALASPAADALGRAGFEGAIDTKFWDRFGGALLLSQVDDTAYAVAGARDAGQARLPSDAATVALQGSAAISPSLRKAPGGEVSIFVAHDLDFSQVYGLRTTP